VEGEERDRLHVAFSMDCLPAGGRGDVRGPERWDQAERSLAAFVEMLAGQGFVGTLFLAPEALGRLRDRAAEAGDAGCELGLLCHPQLSNYVAHLGSYSFERQREIVGLARKAWQDVVAEPARTFRSGFFSANDHTFHVLCMEGFRQSSCSLPGRVDGEQCSMWLGSYPFAHHTDPLDRTRQGTMEVFEVPVTSDFEAASYLSQETYTPPHLRIEEPDVHAYARSLITRHLARMDEDDVQPRVVHLVTSNLVRWGEEEDPHAERLHNLCSMLREVAEEGHMELCPVTLAGLHDVCDEEAGVLWMLEEGD